MPQRRGDVILFDRPPAVDAWAAVGGKKEGEGPLAAGFDLLFEDNRLGQPTWEKAESELQCQCMNQLLRRAGLAPDALSLVFGGDLQCQCTASHYAMRQLDVPFAGLYGACSTMAEGLALAACFAACGLADRAAALTSSHFCTAERQYRTPLTYGGKRTPTAQWTATAAGAVLLTPTGRGPQVGAVCFGRVRDFDVTDINNMGAAMAPAAAETLLRFFARSGRRPEDYDAIYTGDLGFVGSRLLLEILQAEGLPLQNHQDCGLLLYDRARQQVKAGGSGAGCSAAVLAAHILPGLAKGQLRQVLLLSTGALMSQTTFLQGESIPGIAHLVELLAPDVPV